MFKKIAYAHLTISDLLTIRRKVDKATKRADVRWDEGSQDVFRLGEKSKLCVGRLDSCLILKGEYSPIRPDSIGATVRDGEPTHPAIVCADAYDARLVAASPNERPAVSA